MALNNINDINGRFIRMAAKNWWAYTIATQWKLDPREVKTWDAEDVLEALAAIGIIERNMKNNMPK